MGRSKDWLLALAGGALLAVMIDFNSLLAKHSTPVFASWLAHGIGAVVALVLVVLVVLVAASANVLRRANGHRANGHRANGHRANEGVSQDMSRPRAKGPLWAYLGGIPGAMVVVLGAITVNSRLGLSGTLALMLVGQVVFGIVSDHFGLFGVQKRKFVLADLFVILTVLTGSGMIIAFRS